MDQMVSAKLPRAGRPTREQAEARHAHLLDRALDHFLDKGFEQATIEAIAADVRMTKRTVYARYPDKAALFKATVHRAIERYTIPIERIREVDCGDLEQTLINVAMLRINLISSPEGWKMQRIIDTESYRFPEIFSDSFEQATMPTVNFLAEVFERETRAGTLAIDTPHMAAIVFMSMVIGGLARSIVSSNPLPKGQMDKLIHYAVKLFLDGARPR